MSGIEYHTTPPPPPKGIECYFCKKVKPETRSVRSPYGPYSVTLCPLHQADTFMREIEKRRQSGSLV